jgi:hypothetical protein
LGPKNKFLKRGITNLGVSCAYDYEAGIASLGLPGVKIPHNQQKTRAHWHDFCHRDQTHPWRGRTLSPPTTRLPTPSQDPSCHALYLFMCRRGSRSAHHPSRVVPKISTIEDFASTVQNCRSTTAAPLLAARLPRQ